MPRYSHSVSDTVILETIIMTIDIMDAINIHLSTPTDIIPPGVFIIPLNMDAITETSMNTGRHTTKDMIIATIAITENTPYT